jgi:hypothetical protein
MQAKHHIKLPLTEQEKAALKKCRIAVHKILDYDPGELELVLNIPPQRAEEIRALATFQTVPSIGIKFAEDLVFMGYFNFEMLKNKDGAKLLDEFETKKRYRTDPCVEDQFRLAVHYAKTKDTTKNRWDFTEERKKFRLENGYPDSRP